MGIADSRYERKLTVRNSELRKENSNLRKAYGFSDEFASSTNNVSSSLIIENFDLERENKKMISNLGSKVKPTVIFESEFRKKSVDVRKALLRTGNYVVKSDKELSRLREEFPHPEHADGVYV